MQRIPRSSLLWSYFYRLLLTNGFCFELHNGFAQQLQLQEANNNLEEQKQGSDESEEEEEEEENLEDSDDEMESGSEVGA